MKIAIVRHGMTEENYLRKIQGRYNSLLNDSGRRACMRLKEQIKDKEFDYCYMSPLIRCVETAIILVGDRVETIPDKRLIERDMGEFERKEIDSYDRAKYWNYSLNCSEQNVEPVQDIFKRCSDFLDYIKEKHKGQSILIVTHSAPARVIHHLLLNSDKNSNLLDVDIKNCYYEEFLIDD